MNVHGMVADVIGNVNPNRVITCKRSIGYTKGANYQQTPEYRNIMVLANIQALSGTEIQRLNSLNIQGILKAIYVHGKFDAIVRMSGKGGDLFQFDRQTWLAVHVLENWESWTKLAVQLQTDPTL